MSKENKYIPSENFLKECGFKPMINIENLHWGYEIEITKDHYIQYILPFVLCQNGNEFRIISYGQDLEEIILNISSDTELRTFIKCIGGAK